MSQHSETHVYGFQKAVVSIMASETVQHRAAKALKPFVTHVHGKRLTNVLLDQGVLMVTSGRMLLITCNINHNNNNLIKLLLITPPTFVITMRASQG